MSGSDGEDGVASRLDVQSLTSQLTPGRWMRGGGVASSAMSAVTSEKTLAREPSLVVAEAQQYPVAADAQVCSESPCTDASLHEIENGVMQKVFQLTSFPRVTDSC